MAIIRSIRTTGVTRGVSTAINGVTSVGFTITSVGRSGISDGEHIITSHDVTKWSITGFVELDDLAEAGVLRSAAQEQLKVSFTTDDIVGPAAKTRTFDKISWGGIESVEIPDVESGGNVTRYKVPFRIVGINTDTAPSDLITIA